MSDGEFRFAMGDLAPDLRLPVGKRMRLRAAQVINRVLTAGKFEAGVIFPTARLLYGLRLRKWSETQALGAYHSGEYTWLEWWRAKNHYAELLREISERGILAIHLTYGQSFGQGHFQQLASWLDRYGIGLTDRNYVPLPFVYAAFTGHRRSELLQGKRLLAVTHADPKKRASVEAALAREGVADVYWLEISGRKSLYDSIDPSPYVNRVDLAVVGAGVGKPNILARLEPLQVPCIDVGFVFEVWAQPKRARWRDFCAPYPLEGHPTDTLVPDS